MRILRNTDGATAVEFALVLPFFLVFVLGIMDLGAYYFVAGQLQNGVEQAARSIRVGDANYTGIDADTSTAGQEERFVQLVCSNIHTGMILDCLNNVRVDVRSFATFTGSSAYDNTDLNGDGTVDSNDSCYNAGTGGQAVIARAYYRYNFIIPQMGALTGGTSTSHVDTEIVATTAFRNEPFPGGGGTGSGCS